MAVVARDSAPGAAAGASRPAAASRLMASMAGLGTLGLIGAVLPLAMTVALTALELLMAVIQAYVFTILTCVYLRDAVGDAHH